MLEVYPNLGKMVVKQDEKVKRNEKGSMYHIGRHG
jgi:hypothetical protein